MRTLMRTLPQKHRVCECFSLGLPFLKRLYSNVCHVLLCVFSLTNIGFVQCLSLGPLLSLYVYLCHVMLCYVMRTLPHKHLCHVIQYYALLLQLVFALRFISLTGIIINKFCS